MALLTLQAFKKKWADLTGRFKDNNTFDIAEKDYREFSTDIADSLFEPVESLRARVEKLEQPAPAPPEGVKWKVYPKVSIEGSTVKVTPSEAEFQGNGVPLPSPNAKENVPAPPAGWGTRIDILAATATGWAYIYGEDPGVTPAMEIEGQPEAELLFAAYLFWNNAGGVVEEPVVFVKVVEMDGQAYAPDANGRLILPKSGTTINSTDDIKSEGATNKWFTDARTYLSKATGYVIQGTTRAITQSDSLAMILGIYENRLNLLTTGKQDKLTFDNTPTTGSANPVTSSGVKTYVDNLTNANGRLIRLYLTQEGRTHFEYFLGKAAIINSIQARGDASSFSIQLFKEAAGVMVGGVVHTTIANAQAEINALTLAERNAGYGLLFAFGLIAGGEVGAGIIDITEA